MYKDFKIPTVCPGFHFTVCRTIGRFTVVARDKDNHKTIGNFRWIAARDNGNHKSGGNTRLDSGSKLI